MTLKMCRTQSVLALLALYVGLAQSWDVAVSFGDKLKFYTRDYLISTITFESQMLTALAYDDVHKRILYVDRHANGDAICGYTLSSVENTCFTERTGRNIHGIAYDSSTETVFFTDTNDRSVNTVSLKPGSQNNASGNLLIKINEGIPRDIIVDSCKRHFYWLTTDKSQPTIERARFNGTAIEVFRTLNYLYINSTYQFEPHSLTIEPSIQKIYWVEPWNTTQYRVYSSSVLDMDNTQKHTDYYCHLESAPVFIHPSNTLAVSKFYEYSQRLFYIVDFGRTGANVYILTDDLFNIPGKIVHKGADTKVPVGIVANYHTEQDKDYYYYRSERRNYDCE